MEHPRLVIGRASLYYNPDDVELLRTRGAEFKSFKLGERDEQAGTGYGALRYTAPSKTSAVTV
jgi:hypothetical protein